MRLARLDLTRYGKFTDHRIDFGPRQPGRPDLHIVYGPNEAGKSTALSAFLDLLFGVEAQSRYGFLHPYPTMRIGAAIELDGAVRELVRIKRPQNSLLDDKGQVVAESVVLRDLGGIERESYRTMFSLDDETLEAGGKSILASKGDLGQLLFSASAGLADLSQTLIELKGEAEGFYKARARSGQLLELKNRLATLKERKAEIDTLASAYAQLIENRDRASAQYEEASGENRRIRARMEEVQRHLSTLPRLTALRNILAELAPLAELPEAPAAWLRDLPTLQKEDAELSTRSQAFGEDIKRLSDEIGAIAHDEAALKIAERVDRLAVSRARYVTAENDLPARRLERRDGDVAIAGILRRLEREGEAHPKTLLLAASTTVALRNLIESRSGVDAALETTRSELAGAEERLADARKRLEDSGGGLGAAHETNPAASALKAVAATLRGADHAARRRMAEKLRTNLVETLAERMAALAPWSGDGEALARMSAPDLADMESWKAALAEAQKQSDRLGADAERLAGEQARLSAEMAAIGAGRGLVDDGEAATIRAAREEAWAAHRRQLDPATADAFEDVLRRDDLAVHARLSYASDVAKLQQLRQALAVVEADLAGTRKLLTDRIAGATRLREQVAAAVAVMSAAMPPDLSLAQLKTWLDRRDKALEIWSNLKQAERDLREADADAETARDKIRAALALAGVDHDSNADFDALLATAQSAVEREADLKLLRREVAERREDAKRRQRDFEGAIAAEQKWSDAWEAAISKCWLAEAGAGREIATVREALADIANLGPAIDAQASLGDRIEKMEADQRAFAQETAGIAAELGGGFEPGDAQGLADAINNRVRRARADEAARAAKIKEIDALRRRRRETDSAIEVHRKRKGEMTDLFAVASLSEVDAKLRKIEEKAALQKRRGEAEGDILDALGAASLAEAETILANADRGALEGELAELKARFEDQDQRARDLFAMRSKAADQVEAVGGDDAAAAIEQERRTILVEIEEKALRHFRLRAGIVAAEEALRVYRDKRRSSMMTRASEAFKIISRGAYKSLAAQPGKDGEVLIGVGANGRSKVAADMSKGARFQLYLALRVAGYEAFARSRGSAPFIADDIMETFDDFRAEEAFRLFSAMAEVGQVIYLTHHRHLCDIARSACPHVKVHELTADAAA